MRLKFGPFSYGSLEATRAAFIVPIVILAVAAWLAGSRGALRGLLLAMGGLGVILLGLWTIRHASELAKMTERRLKGLQRFGHTPSQDLTKKTQASGLTMLVIGTVVVVFGVIMTLSPSLLSK